MPMRGLPFTAFLPLAFPSTKDHGTGTVADPSTCTAFLRATRSFSFGASTCSLANGSLCRLCPWTSILSRASCIQHLWGRCFHLAGYVVAMVGILTWQVVSLPIISPWRHTTSHTHVPWRTACSKHFICGTIGPTPYCSSVLELPYSEVLRRYAADPIDSWRLACCLRPQPANQPFEFL